MTTTAKQEYEQEKAWIASELGNLYLQGDHEKVVDLWFRAIRLELQYQFGHNPQGRFSLRD